MASSRPRDARPGEAPALRRFTRVAIALAEGLAYSSLLAALVGGATTWATGRALGSPDVPRDAALVACGVFLIYNVDRLRDLARDHPGSPGRTAFVLQHRTGLVVATALAGLALTALLAAAPAASAALCLAVGAIGFLHRRLKQEVGFKIAYVAGAWTAACVGLPGLAVRGGEGATIGALGAAMLFVGAALVSNLIASNLREAKRVAAGWSVRGGLRVARIVAIAATAGASAAPEHVSPLAWIPAAEALALGFFRPSERYGHLAVDGALLLGALIAIAQLGR